MISIGCALLACLAHSPASPGKPLLSNGDFEAGATQRPRDWYSIWPRSLESRAPTFEWSEDRPHGGSHCVELHELEGKGFASFTQEVGAPPKNARSARLTGWVRFEAAPGEAGVASLMIFFWDPAKQDSSVVREARMRTDAPHDANGWTRVELVCAVPPSATNWMVRCGLTGTGTASFDDVELTASDDDVEVVTLGHVSSGYRLDAGEPGSDPWIEVVFPFPFELQTPLAVAVSSVPAGRVTRLELVPDDENRYLRAHLDPARARGVTELRVDALVALRALERGDGTGVRLAPRAKLPANVAAYFAKTPGIDPDHAGIRDVAKTVKTATLAEAVDGVLRWMKANVTYEGGGDQGGAASFERKNAVCTGHANVAASLFQAAGVPARILGTLPFGRLQQHYIVEVWTPSERWRRVESTAHLFPMPDDAQVVLHVAPPAFDRSPLNVPLRLRASHGCRASYQMDAKGCWQGMESAGTAVLTPDEAKRVETLARQQFAAWEADPVAADTARLLTVARARELGLSASARELAENAARFPQP